MTQEVFTLVYARLEEVARHENPAGFIYQTAKFQAANFKRKQSTKGQHEYSMADKELEGNVQSAYEGMLQIEDEIIDETSYIDDVLCTMDEAQRELYHYRYVEKKNYKDIARLLGINEVTLRMRCLRLKKKLQKKIQEVGVQYFE